MDVCKVNSWVPYKMVALGQGGKCAGGFTYNLSYTALSHTTLSRTALSHTIAFVWQAWPLVTLMFLLLGHRGAFV